MTIDEAESVVMPFGKHRGRTIREIADTDEGLLYLDWASDLEVRTARDIRLKEAIITVTSHHAGTIERLLEERER